ncbi:hypothetical protein [Sphingomonas adhaesiva]|uniref:hypothetical protein n=1 Tax=Sphingomonas adhaesiva TaxID=28212 RepID=UPI002FF774B7
MGSLTDGAIRRSIKEVEMTGKQKSLADGEGRGVGRLILALRPMPKRVIAEWMASSGATGKRIKAKLGDYPLDVALWSARGVQARLCGRDPEGSQHQDRDRHPAGHGRRPFRRICRGSQGCRKPSWKETEKGLEKVADTLGRNRLAREIEPEEVTEVLRPIFERGLPRNGGSCPLLHPCRLQLGYEIRARLPQHVPSALRLLYNPAAGIPTEPKVQGTRWLG